MYSRLDALNYNGANSLEDFGLLLKTKTIGAAAPDEIRETVPYMSGDYDFTGAFAPVSYRSRKIQVSFKFKADSENELFEKRAAVVQWLSARNVNVTFDSMPDYTFTGCSARLKSYKPWNKDTRYGSIDIEITCDPYIRIAGKFDTRLIEYTGNIFFAAFYWGTKNYTVTNQSDIMSFGRAGPLYLRSTTMDDNTVPVVIDVVNNTSATVSFKNITNITKQGTITIDGVTHTFWKYDPETDRDDTDSAWFQVDTTSELIATTSATLYIGDIVDPLDDIKIKMCKSDGTYITDVPPKAYSKFIVLSSGLGDGGLCYEQTENYKEVL